MSRFWFLGLILAIHLILAGTAFADSPADALGEPVGTMDEAQLLYCWQLTADHMSRDDQSAAQEIGFKPLIGSLVAKPTAERVIFAADSPGGLRLDSDGKNHPHLEVSPTIKGLKLPSQEITLAAWVAIDKPMAWGGIVGAIQDNGDYEKGWLLGYRNAQFCFAVHSAGSSVLTYLTSPREFQPGCWYYVVGTYDGQYQRLYIDGSLVAQADQQAGEIVYPDDAPFVIGAYRDDNELYGISGQIERVEVWEKALSSREIATRFARRKERFPDIDAVHPNVVDWPTWMRDNQRTGIVAESLELPLRRSWTYVPRYPPRPAWPPPARQDLWNRRDNLAPRVIYDRAFHVVAKGDSVLFGSSSEDSVTCLDATTGQHRWTFFAEAPVRLAPTIDGERVLFGADDGRVYCLDLATGTLLWQFAAFEQDRRIVGNGRMISERPVRTGVIVEDGVAWFCAGLFPDQGVEQFALSVSDGRLRARVPVAASPQGYMERRGDRLLIPTGRDPAGTFAAGLTRRGKGVDKFVQSIGNDYRYAFISAGEIRFGGGQGQVAAFAARDGRELWKTTVDGIAWGLAIAGQRLYVSLDTGRIECFEAAGTDESVAASPAVIDGRQLRLSGQATDATVAGTAGPTDPQLVTEITRLVAQSNVARGWCLAATANQDWLAELAQQTQWNIVGLAPDQATADSSRRGLADLGLQGNRIVIHHIAPEQDLPYSDYLFNVVIDPQYFGSGSGSDQGQELPWQSADSWSRVLRPSGGVLWENRGQEAPTIRGELPGAGQWTHQYADPANTVCSGDQHDYRSLRVQWFGEPGPREMIDRHHRTSAPLTVAGRLFIPGDNRVYGVDAYNGTLLWEREIEQSRRIAVFRDSSQLAAGPDALFVATADRCLVLDAATGYVRNVLEIPANEDGSRHWGYLAHLREEGLVLGSSVRPTAPRREISREVAAKETFWDHVPLVGSDRLFAIAPDDPQRSWSYRASTGLLINPTIAVADGRVWMIESNAPETLEATSGRATAQQLISQGAWLTALDTRDGTQILRRELPLRQTQHNLYLSIAQGKVVVVGSRNSGTEKKTAEVLYDILVFDATDASLAWQTTQHQGIGIGGDHGEQDHRPVMVGDRLYCEPFGYDLHHGHRLSDFGWTAKHRRGCGNISASARTFFFRENVLSMFDLASNEKMRVTQNMRPGCWINALPAGGLLLAPEASSGCTCNYAIQASIAFLPVSPPADDDR